MEFHGRHYIVRNAEDGLPIWITHSHTTWKVAGANATKRIKKMANLRKEARGRECQVRLPGICNGNPETVVLAHYRMVGICGTGMKPDDLFGAWACSACHDEIDRRTRRCDVTQARIAHLEGVIRTQDALLKEGKVKR